MGRHKITRNCSQCGQPTKKQRKFCSNYCYALSKIRDVVMECSNCGNEFTTKQHRINQGRRFCSVACKVESSKGD